MEEPQTEMARTTRAYPEFTGASARLSRRTRGGWLRGLAQEGVGPRPGPRTGRRHPMGRRRDFAHL
eukprot:2958507-Alexandrium_andersonii.AAC.1